MTCYMRGWSATVHRVISEDLTEKKILHLRIEEDKVGSYTDNWGKNILSRRNTESKNPEAVHLGPVQDQRGWSGVRREGVGGMSSQRQGWL